MENRTPKHVVLQLGSLITLYLSLTFLLVLIFGVINLRFPDSAEGYWAIESASSSVRLGIAMVVIFFPTYLILTRYVNTLRRAEKNESYISLTKWLVYLSLLVAGLTLLGDLVAVLLQFLEGSLTQRFIWKAIAVFVVIGAAFYYYLLDARGHWHNNEKQSIVYGVVAAIVATIAVVFGFSYIETPTEVRERKLDAAQISDLQQIQWGIESYLSNNEQLPESLADVEIVPLPTAPEERPPYTYRVTDTGFSLCATFAYPSQPELYPVRPEFDTARPIRNADNWSHREREVCFDRVVTTTVE